MSNLKKKWDNFKKILEEENYTSKPTKIIFDVLSPIH
jgi:hypothetical protein